jgi:hypothetical protein
MLRGKTMECISLISLAVGKKNSVYLLLSTRRNKNLYFSFSLLMIVMK